MSRVLDQLEHGRSPVVVLLDLRVRDRARPVVGDRGRHDDDVGVRRPPRATAVAQLRARCSTRDDVDPGGPGTSMFAATSVTSAPRRGGRRRGRRPAGRDERLPRKRTGSSGSRVPPAVTTTCRPARSARGGRRPARGPRRAISSGSAIRPGPVSAPVSRPAAGSETWTPRARSVATFATVAGCCHISVCIAGASSDRAARASSVVLSRSSARPCAARASRSAVAGATRSRGRPAGRAATCAHLGDALEEVGGHRLAATGPPSVGRPTNSSAASVGTTWTSCPASRSRRRSSDRLVGGDPARDAEDDAHGARAVSPRWRSDVSRPASISRMATESGFSCGRVSTSGPTYSNRPSFSWE